ncbi:MAG: pseudouridine synthase [candidate division Zixibacteria bacterium]
MRINKYLSKAGIASRRAAETLILEGRVKVNGEVITELGTIVNEDADEVLFDDKTVKPVEEYVYIILNKPSGYLVTCKDEFNRPKVTDLLGKYGRVAKPVGRLDLDSSGLLLLTNNGEIAFRLSHPKYKINKKYLVKCEGFLNDEKIGKLSDGIKLDDGKTWPAAVEIISRTDNFTKIYMTIHEGRKRQIRRMCQALGHNVRSLSRVNYGDLDLGNLKSGSYRLLKEAEIKQLKVSVGYEKS